MFVWFKQRKLAICLALFVLISAGLVGIGYYFLVVRTKTSAPRVVIGPEQRRQASIANSQKRQAQEAAVFQEEYNSTKGIASLADFKKRFPKDLAEPKVLLVMNRMNDEQHYQSTLDLAQYSEAQYPVVAGNIDFVIRAYEAAKALNKPDLQLAYKQRAQKVLRAQGVLTPDQAVNMDALTAKGQSE